MARIRTIKPEFWDSPDTARASFRGRLFYIALWNWADDYGKGTASAKQLVGFAFPNDDDITVADYPSLASDVANCFGVVFYEVDRRPYYFIPSFSEHQRTEKRATSRIPDPPDGVSAGQTVDTPNSDGSTVDSDGGTVPVTGEQGNRGTGEQGNITTADAAERDDVDRLCEHLADRIETNGSQRPYIGKTWTDAARLLLDKDGRDETEVHAAIDWCQTDDFWRANILSMPKLRQKYDQLRLNAARGSPTAASSNIDKHLALVTQLAQEEADERRQIGRA